MDGVNQAGTSTNVVYCIVKNVNFVPLGSGVLLWMDGVLLQGVMFECG